jgi:hypothetical protein
MAADDPTLNTILQKHLEAMGGLNNWNRIESIQLNGTIERDGQTVDIVIVKKRPNQIRATVTVPILGKEDEAFQIIRAHDGKTAWTATRLAGAKEMQKEVLPAEAADQLLADAGVLPPLVKLWREGADLELLGTKSMDGINHFAIRVIPEDLPQQYTFYLSGESYLIAHYESTHPADGISKTIMADYRREQNILVPQLVIIESPQTGQSVMATTSVKIGVGIYEEYFSPATPTASAKL